MKLLLPAVFFALAAEAIHFQCDFVYADHETVGTLYTCEGFVIVSWSSELEGVWGTHQAGKTHDDVEAISVNSQGLQRFPVGMEAFFANLKVLDFRRPSLSLITADNLQSFPQLRVLHVFSGNIVTVPGDLFSFTPMLTSVSFERNNIWHIGHGLVANLGNLTNLHLEDNLCVNRWAKNRVEVLELASQLSILCPPRDVPTTTTPTTTEITTCLCDEEIDDLRLENQQQNLEMEQKNKEIQQLQSLVAAIEVRLREVENQLR